MSAPTRKYTGSGGGKSNASDSTNRGLFDFGLVLIGETDAFGWCPICFNMLDMNGATNEHILTDTEHRAIFGRAFEAREYNADCNMMQAHARCNASKGTRGIFAKWRDGRPTGLSDDQYAALINILDYYANTRAKSSIGHFPKGEYRKTLLYIVSVVTGRTPETIQHYTRQS